MAASCPIRQRQRTDHSLVSPDSYAQRWQLRGRGPLTKRPETANVARLINANGKISPCVKTNWREVGTKSYLGMKSFPHPRRQLLRELVTNNKESQSAR